MLAIVAVGFLIASDPDACSMIHRDCGWPAVQRTSPVFLAPPPTSLVPRRPPSSPPRPFPAAYPSTPAPRNAFGASALACITASGLLWASEQGGRVFGPIAASVRGRVYSSVREWSAHGFRGG